MNRGLHHRAQSHGNGQATTTSNEVAEYFGKDHAEVLKRIRALLPQLPGHAGFIAAMVNEVQIGSSAIRKDPAYRLTLFFAGVRNMVIQCTITACTQ